MRSPLQDASAPELFDSRRIERVFGGCFEKAFQTELRGGAAEPLYQPAWSTNERHRLWYREDYFASALHEVAHWCIAGESRRKEVDFGYWYAPDGRSVEQQQAFEVVESGPQALEWFFSRACGYRFRLSLDNLGGDPDIRQHCVSFGQRVCHRAQQWQRAGLPPRAMSFFHGLCAEFGVSRSVFHRPFDQEQLR